MSGSEGLGYGTQVMIDGAFADAAKLADQAGASELLQRIVADVEPSVAGAPNSSSANYDAGADGYSVALIQGETAAMLHTFPQLRRVTLHLFSAHDLHLSSTTRAFLAAFAVGRFQSAVRAYGQYPPRDPEQLQRALAGQRSYARLRLTPPPVVST